MRKATSSGPRKRVGKASQGIDLRVGPRCESRAKPHGRIGHPQQPGGDQLVAHRTDGVRAIRAERASHVEDIAAMLLQPAG